MIAARELARSVLAGNNGAGETVPGRLAVAVRISVLVAAAVAFTHLLLRVGHLFFWNAPFIATVSGGEEESLFAIWKAASGMTVFANPLKPPFAISYFNWLFYLIYGALAKTLFVWAGWDWVWMPTVMRTLTLAFGAGSMGVVLFIAHEIRVWPDGWSRLERVAMAALLTLASPLMGYTIITVRPDSAAVFIELIGLLAVLRYLGKGNLKSLIVTTLVLYLAWSLKQTHIGVVTGFALLLLWRRRWKELAIVAFLSCGLYLATFAIGGELYRFAVLKSQVNCPMNLRNALHVVGAVLRSAHWLAFGGIAALLLVSSRGWEQRDIRTQTIVVTFFTCLFWSLVSTPKNGSGINYFMTTSVMAGLCLLVSLRQFGWPAWQARWCAFGFLVSAVILTLHLTLMSTNIFKRYDILVENNNRFVELRGHVQQMPSPVFVEDIAANLPWILPAAPYFIVAYTYELDRAAGRRYEEGGIAGLVERGFFKSIILRKTNKRLELDGQPLCGYKEVHVDSRYRYFLLEKIRR